MEFDWHRMPARPVGPRARGGSEAPAEAGSMLRRLLGGLAARRHRRDMERLTAHLAWTSAQREALRVRPKRRT